jgi:HD-like signal output (HDOD) protein
MGDNTRPSGDGEERTRARIRRLTELPPLSLVASRLLGMLSDEDAEIAAVAGTIELDPALSARVIGVARSAFFGNPGAIYTVKDAIIRVLGLDMVRSLALGISLGDSFSVERRVGLDVHRFWTTALLTAELSGMVAPRLDAPDAPEADAAYLCGLLHNLGLLPLAHLFPEEMASVLRTSAGAPDWTLAPLEQEALGVDHHQAGAWLAHRWHLPRCVMLVMQHYHEPEYRDEQWAANLLVGTCSRWAQWRLENEGEGVDEALVAPLRILGLDDQAVDRSLRLFERRFEQTLEMAHVLSKGS